MTGSGRNGSPNVRSPRFRRQRPRLFGRQLLLATAAAGKSLPNVEDLAGTCTYARAHDIRAIILSRIARGARSSSTKERERVPHELLPRCSRSGTPVELFLKVPRSRLLDGQNILVRMVAHGPAVSSSTSTRRETLTSFDSNTCSCFRAGPRSLSHAIGGVSE
jgi:hypothetical protein